MKPPTATLGWAVAANVPKMPRVSPRSLPAVTPLTPHPASPPQSDLIDEDPRDTLLRIIGLEEARVSRRRTELAQARNALSRLTTTGVVRDTGAMAPLTADVAPTLIRNLIDDTTGPIRDAVITATVGPAVDRDLIGHAHDTIRAGREYRSLYDARVLDCPREQEEIAAWRQMGEIQRLYSGVPSEFAVYGREAVVAVDTWGDATSDFVVIREPMLIQAFVSLFDRMWEHGYPFPSERVPAAQEDSALLDLLGRGLKDEAIARYLGWSLRTVRRRVARLMEELGADTRFQLGAEAVRTGRLTTLDARPEASARRESRTG